MVKIIRKPLTLLLCIAFLASCIRTSYALRPMSSAPFRGLADSDTNAHERTWLPKMQHVAEREQDLRLYHLFLKSTDQKAVIISRVEKIIEDSFDNERLKEEGVMLDVGTSDGLILKALMHNFSLCVSIEPDEKATKKLQEENIPGLMVVTDFIQNYSPPDGERYDFILVSHMLYYIEVEERKKQVERITSWLKPGGKLVLIHGANIQSGKHDKVRMMRKLGSGDTDVESEKIIAHMEEKGYTVTSEPLESKVVANLEDMVDILKFLLRIPLPELEPRTSELREYVKVNLWDEKMQTYRLRIPQDVVIVTVGSAASRIELSQPPFDAQA